MATLTIGESRLSYWESGSGVPLVFIHGVATSGELWRDDLAPLAADCRLIVYDRRGYGASSPSPRSWAAHTDDARALLEAVAAAPAVLVGYSGGAMIALDLAMRHPELVAGIVLLDPAFNLGRCLTPELLTIVAAMRLLRLMRGDRAAAALWLRYVSSYATGGSAFMQKAPAARRERLLANAPGIFADFAAGSGRVEERGLAGIHAPITLVEAALSPKFLRRSCARLGHLLPQATRVTLEHSGHWAGLDAREAVLDALRAAVRGAAWPGSVSAH
jgi:pimeloyl-ACP methyl ester carboxylesterase